MVLFLMERQQLAALCRNEVEANLVPRVSRWRAFNLPTKAAPVN